MKIEIKFEIEGQEVPLDKLDSLLKNDMLRAAVDHMAETAQEQLGDTRCKEHGERPQVVISLSSLLGLRTYVTGCCNDLVEKATAPLTDVLNQTAHFGARMNIVLEIRGTTKLFIFDTDKIERELILGRRNGHEAPDVDLYEYGGMEKGVSRRHASVLWRDGELHIVDNGSANGTFINGERLVPHQPRLLQHGDDIRLGFMVLRVRFEYADQQTR